MIRFRVFSDKSGNPGLKELTAWLSRFCVKHDARLTVDCIRPKTVSGELFHYVDLYGKYRKEIEEYYEEKKGD